MYDLHSALDHHDRTTFVRANDVYVYDSKGKQYLDAIGGVGVVNVGHGVKEIVDALSQQAGTLAFSYGVHIDNEPRKALSKKLDDWAPGGMKPVKTLFSSGGAEANEGAIKLAYQYHWERGNPCKRRFISRWQSYHGNTVGTLSLSGRTKWRRMHDALLMDVPFIPPPYCYRCPWNLVYPGCELLCAKALGRTIQQLGQENIAAFVVEPIIGTTMSAVVPPDGYYQKIREICDENDVLFIADEVMSGIGRTGLNWGIENWSVTPDILTASKGLAGGYSPLGAAILSEKVWLAIENGTKKPMHSCTFGGNPASCAAGLAVLNYIEQYDLVSQAGIMGDRLLDCLFHELGGLSCVGDIRGKGLFIGIELVADKRTKKSFPPELDVAHKIEKAAFEKGLLIMAGVPGLLDGIGGDHLEILPPYTIQDEHIDFITSVLRECMDDWI